jgi:hypothetical protein
MRQAATICGFDFSYGFWIMPVCNRRSLQEWCAVPRASCRPLTGFEYGPDAASRPRISEEDAVDGESQDRTLALYMSTRFSTPFWGVHFRLGSEPLATLCGMDFDDNGRSLTPGMFSADEVLAPADGEPLSCPQCIQIIDELNCLELNRNAGEAIRRKFEAALRRSAGAGG